MQPDFDSTIAYFTESIHAWVQQTGLGQKGEKFSLVGHSMGGMFIGYYALKHPELIESLIFMSSVGISTAPDFLQPDAVIKSLDGRLARYGG